jgi:hypothetical protein
MPDARRTLAIFLIVAACLLPACTRGGASPTASSSSAVASGEGPVTKNEDVSFVPGEFRYSFNNVTATFTLHGSKGTLVVKNGSGADLGAPSIYAITRDDHRFDAQIATAATVADGSQTSFEVAFPPDVTEKTEGLIILRFGDENFGAFAPVEAPSASASASP